MKKNSAFQKVEIYAVKSNINLGGGLLLKSQHCAQENWKEITKKNKKNNNKTMLNLTRQLMKTVITVTRNLLISLTKNQNNRKTFDLIILNFLL